MTAGRWPLIIEGNYTTVPLTAEVQNVITRWIRENVGTLDEALQPFGLGAADVALPDWHRLVYEDELPNHAGRSAT